jgi:peroxiredoxin
METLRVGDRFPELQGRAVDGSTLRLPDGLRDSIGVLLFYRGHWWSHCRQQLADFQQHKAELDALNAEIVALSADREEDAWGTVERLGLRYRVLYGLDPEATSRAIGCYTGTHDGRPHVQPAAFVLRPDGRIAHAVYSSGNVGRLTAGDAVTIAKELRE